MKFSEIERKQNQVKEIFRRHECVYVFGAGAFAVALIKWLKLSGLNPKGVVVTDAKVKYVNDVEVRTLDQKAKYNGALIVAVSSKYHSEILQIVSACFDEVIVLPNAFFGFLIFMQNLEIKEVDGWEKCNDVNRFYKYISKKKVIFLHRTGGLGDALIAEPICRKLKEDGYCVGVLTKVKDIFYHSHSVDFLSYSSGGSFLDGIPYIGLSYGYMPFYHILDAYIFNVRHFFPELEILSNERLPVYDRTLIRKHNGEVKNVCINVEASGWKTRIYDPTKMKMFADYLSKKGYNLFEIGSDKENYLGVGENCFDLSLRETIDLMSKSDLYVGLDNGLMHLAQSIKLPVFVLFGCVCPLYRIHDWSTARVLWKNVDELPCAGCFHRREIPCGDPTCIHEDCKCLDWSVDEVIYAFENLKYNEPPILNREMLRPIMLQK